MSAKPQWRHRPDTRPKSRLTAAELAEERLKAARAVVANVLWNFNEHPDDPALRDVEAWKRVFEHLRDLLG